MKRHSIVSVVAYSFLFVGLGAVGVTQEPANKNQTWQSLVKENKCVEAEKLCEGWLASTDADKKAEAHKCLANATLCGAEMMSIQAGDVGGGYIEGSYRPEAIDKALTHLERALQLTPQDLSIHQGRLHLLSLGARFQLMPKALEDSLETYQGSTAEVWVPYSYELYEKEQFHAAVDFLKVLEKKFPNDHETIGNLGSFYSMLREDDKAVPYLLRAVELAPDDPIDTWNLGRFYDYTGKLDLAEKWYTKSLTVDDDPGRKRDNFCLFATFLAKQKQFARACEIQKKNECEQTACKPASGQEK